ncbi:MAG: DNA-binding protein [Gammaproteobacteria bacterium]|nr:DNA-binding protein [Gammaproteobacteria bacterium]
MKEYEFTLRFRLSNATESPEIYVEKLGAKGCNDALIGIGKKGCIALNFTRAAASASDAVTSAITQVRESVPNARLTEISPDFVGLSDVAELLGFTSQSMRKIMVSSGARFPEPVHEGKPSIWHLANILIWLKNQELYPVAEELVELAKINMQFNITKDMQHVDPSFCMKIFNPILSVS